MEPYQKTFIELALKYQVLQFGEFTLKSGRVSPYFFNAGLFNSGLALAELGDCYAEAIIKSGVSFDVLFGPAYKGIPLAATTSVALAKQHALDKAYCFNRKEAKDHGEGGSLVGAPLKGKVLIVDDVMTAGTAARESIEIIKAEGAEVAGICVAIDRQERGKSERSAIQEIEQDFNIPVVSIIQLDSILSYLEETGENPDTLEAMRKYQTEYGV